MKVTIQMAFRSVAAWLVLIVVTVKVVDAAEPETAQPFLSVRDGIASQSRWLNPGKIDLLFRGRESDQNFNAFLWTPTFKGGAGFIDPRDGESTTYAGGFLRPLAGWPARGDLIVAAQGVDGRNRRDFEAQAEYRLPVGLGLGGGFAEALQTGNDLVFGKVTWRNKWAGWNYIFELQGQEVESEVSPGGYAALFNEQLMGVFGHDGEQWRATAGYVAPRNSGMLRPAMEALYVDNSIGEFDGPKSVFANATLQLQGGFLAHPARLGRAMGPQGLEFGNPLGFLFPTWNRRLETWEMGGLLDLRYERIWFPNRTTQDRFEGVVFPFQFAHMNNPLDYIFAGATYTKSPAKDTPGIVGGFLGKIGFLQVNVGVEHQLYPGDTTVVLGLIDWF
jgi:hypothetical protein